jgi:hypothetical protein
MTNRPHDSPPQIARLLSTREVRELEKLPLFRNELAA